MTVWGKMDRVVGRIIDIGCVAAALYYLYTGFFGFGDLLSQLGPLLMLALFTVFIKKPLLKTGGWPRIIDYAFALASVGILVRMIYQQQDQNIWVLPPTGIDLVLAWLLILLVIEATRRVMGLALPIIATVAILYGRFGSYLPPPLYHVPFDWDRLAWVTTYGEMGIFGVPLITAGQMVVFFIIFSSFLHGTGASTGFVNLGSSLFGRFRGGPAKAAVVSSALFGTISGSAVASVATTGTFTIPLMKRTGYSATMAAAVEALASTGGQIMPPIMGAAAFIMANYIGVPYRDVALAAVLPAVLYYLSLFTVVDLEAAKLGLKGLSREERPTLRQAVVTAWPVLIALAVLVYFLFVAQISAMKAVLYSLVGLVLVGFLTKQGRNGLWHIWELLRNGARDMTLLTMATACCGIVIGMLYVTNIGVELSGILVNLSRGMPLLLLVLAMLVSLIMGMGVPTVACYLVLAAVVAPALVNMGFSVMAAHLFILYFGCLSSITPPVAMASIAAAGLAGTDPMATGWRATWLGLIVFIIPYFFVFGPALLFRGDPGTVVVAAVTAVIGTVAFAAMLQGYLIRKTNIVQRGLLGAGGLLLIYPDWLTSAAGLALAAFAVVWQLIERKSVVTYTQAG